MDKQFFELAPYLVGMIGAGLALFLFLEMKKMQVDFQQRWNKRQQILSSEMGSLRGTVEEMRHKLSELEDLHEVTPVANGQMRSLNLNRRSQALRRFSRGENPVQVASDLGFSRCEAELLVKIHRVLAIPARRREATEASN